MIGIGIDLGASTTKGVAVKLLESGNVSLLEAVVVPSTELRARAGELGSALARHRMSAFGRRPPLSLCVSHPECFFDRVRVPLPADTGPVSEEDMQEWMAAGRIAPPGGTKPQDDLWDFRLLRVFRRAADVEALGKKYADGMFVRVPRAVVDSGIPSFKPLTPDGLEPAIIAALNAFLRFYSTGKEPPMLLMTMGANQLQAVHLGSGEVVRVISAPVDSIANAVAKVAKIEPENTGTPIRNSDLSSSDPISDAIKAIVTRALGHIQNALDAEEAASLPQPERVTLCGGLATMRGMPDLVSSALGIHAAVIGQPDRIQTVAIPPAPFPVFLGAIGAALRAAGAAPLPLMSRKRQPAPPKPAEAPAVSVPMSPAAAAIARSRKARAAGPIERLGWRWVAAGLAALVAIVPAGCAITKQSRALNEIRREIALVTPATQELARQDRLVNEYLALTGSGGMSLLPWGTLIVEMAGHVPTGAYLTDLSANRDRLLIQGRMEGRTDIRMKQLLARLRRSPTLKRHGLNPPAL